MPSNYGLYVVPSPIPLLFFTAYLYPFTFTFNVHTVAYPIPLLFHRLLCYGHHDRQMIADTYAATLFEAVRRAEGAEKCPVCHRMSHCAVEAS